MRFFVVLLAITALLISCSSNASTSQPTSIIILSSFTPAISIPVASPTEKPEPQVTPSLVSTPTPILKIPPFATKPVTLKYTRSRAALGSPNELFDVFFGGHSPRETTKLVLYSDGQLILQRTSESIVTKILAQSEIHQLLYRLDEMGLHMIDTNQRHDDTDPLYDFEGRYREVGVTDGAYSCLWVNIEICYYEPYEDFVMPQMKILLQFMEDYTPDNMTLYEPDRILLFVSKGEELYSSFIRQSTASVPWPPDFPSLETQKEKYMYIEGENAEKIFSFVNRSFDPRIFDENGQDYSVLITVVFPHENLSQP